jgi:hypothetical protein
MLYKQSRIVSGSVELGREDVIDANRRLLMVVENSGRVVASRVVYIQGKVERKKKNRNLSFTAEETAAN